ncbi:MAG: DUF455 family protein [Planctomycetota bacterium]|nr:DUF455 family protein [Planctomycetota bacterium]
MEIRTFALALLEASTLEGKLRPPPADLTDDQPGAPLRVQGPVRPPALRHDPVRKVKVPAAEGLRDPAQRPRIVHALANHELQAAELFAWALLAFPEMPAAFRRGCVAILAEEQAHCRLYVERLAELEHEFGDFGVTAHFWRKIERILTPLEFVCVLGLTFENANLDFAGEHAAAARAAGDEATARVLDVVHADETRHVAFAWRWFQRLKPAGADDWETYCHAVGAPHGPERARGATFDAVARHAAGLSPEFIERLEATTPTRPGGAPR